MKVVNEHIIKIKMGGCRTSTYYFPVDDNPINVDLWDKNIYWHSCPRDLVEGIGLVADIISRDPYEIGQEVFASLHIHDNYIIAADYNFNRVSRYRLSYSSPFNIALSCRGIKQIFRRMKGKQLIKVAEVKTIGAEKIIKGMAFDFGDVRIWVPRMEVKEENTCDDPNRGGGFVKYGRTHVISIVENIFNTPCDFIIAISPEIKTNFSSLIAPNADLISIVFMKGKLLFSYQDGKYSSEGEVLIQNLMIKSAIKFYVNKKHFSAALTGKSLMGLINLIDENDLQKILYFKGGRVEHFLRTQ